MTTGSSGNVERTFSVVSKGSGLPDYSVGVSSGQKETSAKQYTLSDQAELAERLGAPHSIDRRGNVVFSDDFSDGLGQWSAATRCAWDGSFSFQGGFSCAMTPVGGGAVAQLARRFRPLDISTAWGIESTFWLTSADMYYQMFLTRNINLVQTQLAVAIGSDGLSVVLAPGVTILACAFPLRFDVWHTAKVVSDFVAGNFVRVLVDDTEFDVSRYVMYAGPTAITQEYVAVQCTCGSGADEVGYIDNIIVTQNNPLE